MYLTYSNPADERSCSSTLEIGLIADRIPLGWASSKEAKDAMGRISEGLVEDVVTKEFGSMHVCALLTMCCILCWCHVAQVKRRQIKGEIRAKNAAENVNSSGKLKQMEEE